MKRVLLGSMPVGGGHHALRDSFLATLQAADPGGRTFEPIVFNSADTRVSGFYSLVVNHVPWFQGIIYDMSRQMWGVRLSVKLNAPLYREARETLRQHRPDVVVSTHFLLSMMFARARRELEMDIPVVNAIPDYGETTLAFYPSDEVLRADYTIAMDRKTYHQLLYKMHHPPARLHLGGFIPRAEFLEVSHLFAGGARLPSAQREALFTQLRAEHPQIRGLDPSRPTLIFLGGSAWTEKTMPVIDQILRNAAFREHINAIVVSGKNEIFRQSLANRVAAQPNFAVFGFVPPKLMAQLIALADVPVLGSLAPASMHELLELRCGPQMLFHYIPGTEEPHVDYIHEQQIGLYEPHPWRMMDALMQVTGFKPASAVIQRLTEAYPNRALAIRADHVERAAELPHFLANIGKVVPLRAPAAYGALATRMGVGVQRASS